MPKTSCKSLDEFLPAPGGGPDAASARVVLMRELEAALGELPAEQREMYLAHELEGVSFQELSARSGVGVNTLLSRKRYAVLHLRHRLQDIYAEIRWIGHGLQFAVLALVVIAGSGQAVVQLWNWSLPAIFGLPIFGFWQAVGLLALSWILFGGMRGMRPRGPWGRMSPEERVLFRQRIKDRCRPATA